MREGRRQGKAGESGGGRRKRGRQEKAGKAGEGKGRQGRQEKAGKAGEGGRRRGRQGKVRAGAQVVLGLIPSDCWLFSLLSIFSL